VRRERVVVLVSHANSRADRTSSVPAVLLSLLALLAAGCGTSGWNAYSTPEGAGLPAAPRPLTSSYVFAALGGDSADELHRLSGANDPASVLRRAWILLQRHRPDDAIDLAAQVIYGAHKPTPDAEAFARYIRAQAYVAKGEAQLGTYDRERALQLSMDRWLTDRLDAMDGKAAPAEPVAAAPSLQILPRADWRPAAQIANRLEPMGKIYRLTVHHSAVLFRSTRPSDSAGQLRLIQHQHIHRPERRYGDIGYHFIVDPAGRIWQGRELKWQGAHARGSNNNGNIGICLLGNFLRGNEGQQPPPAQLKALEQLVAGLTQHYDIGGDQIFGHNDFVTTLCPGSYLNPVVDGLARNRKAALAARRSGRAPASLD
jgi:hypothetical protein